MVNTVLTSMRTGMHQMEIIVIRTYATRIDKIAENAFAEDVKSRMKFTKIVKNTIDKENIVCYNKFTMIMLENVRAR